ncbi:hypothetical protein ACJMK2_021065 [Sinanodonta woodiana]|uniref:ETS domain-containing protein n=1 Tax=Sinanodonta woodiana TaxID=1069815 RepID=A0ABD3U421_SINWO
MLQTIVRKNEREKERHQYLVDPNEEINIGDVPAHNPSHRLDKGQQKSSDQKIHNVRNISQQYPTTCRCCQQASTMEMNYPKQYSSVSDFSNLLPNPPTPNRSGKQRIRGCRLWEFILNLLRDTHFNPKYICWENEEEGKFRIVNSKELARLWGSKKGNTNMTYEKMSRAMRYYYKKKVLAPVLGKRLVYSFGPRANWKR